VGNSGGTATKFNPDEVFASAASDMARMIIYRAPKLEELELMGHGQLRIAVESVWAAAVMDDELLYRKSC
jgi:hypothetical protein